MKGGEFERQISKYLTKWLTGKKRPYAFWRQEASGGLGTIHKDNVIHSGDIKHLLDEGKFLTDFWSIECKTGYPKASFWHLFKRVKNFELKNFWEQAVRDAYRSKKQPMLIYRKKGQKVIVGIPKVLKQDIEIMFGDDLRAFGCITMRFDLQEFPSVCFYDLDDFFRIITPDRMKQFINV